MSTCIHHPDRETRYHCGKHNIYLCEACLACRDPELFCKHRCACPIWFMTRKQKNLDDVDANGRPVVASKGGDADAPVASPPA